MERKCNYRNCCKDISNMRTNAKFCNRKCKSAESVYVLRKKQMIETAIKSEMEIVNFIKYLKGTNN